MPPLSASARLAMAAAVSALLAGAAAAAPDRPSGPAAPSPTMAERAAFDAAQDRAALAVAQERLARAAAAVDDLKRELAPAHLTDPMPEVDRTFGLSPLRSDYADAQRRAAGYRATLGAQHPTLVATEQLMEDLRAQLLAGTRRALASAEREAADGRADVAAAERRLAGALAVPSAAPSAAAAQARPAEAQAEGHGADLRAAARTDVTGSVSAPARPAARGASPLSLPPEAAPATELATARAARPAPADPEPSSSARHPLRSLALALAAAGAAALLAAWAILRLLRPRRTRIFPAPVRRVEPAMVPSRTAAASEMPGPAASGPPPRAPVRPAGAAASAPAVAMQAVAMPAVEVPGAAAAVAGVPVLGRFPVAGDGDPSGGAVAALHATLRAAYGDATARMTVLVVPAAGLAAVDADAAAFALAAAAAAAGRRPLLMEARARGRLRGAFAPSGVHPTAIEAGGAVRSLYRVGPGSAVALLPSDPGEAEAAVAAARPGAARLRGFDTFDTVVLVGDDPAGLAASADFVLLAAPPGASAPELDAAAGPGRAAGRPCGAILVAKAARDASVASAPPSPARPVPPPRRAIEAAPAVRLGLRGSFDPARRRVG